MSSPLTNKSTKRNKILMLKSLNKLSSTMNLSMNMKGRLKRLRRLMSQFIMNNKSHLNILHTKNANYLMNSNNNSLDIKNKKRLTLNNNKKKKRKDLLKMISALIFLNLHIKLKLKESTKFLQCKNMSWRVLIVLSSMISKGLKIHKWTKTKNHIDREV